MKKNAKKRVWADLVKLGTNICNQHNILCSFESRNTWRALRTGIIEKDTYYFIRIVENGSASTEYIELINRISKEISLNGIVSKTDMAELESLYNRYGKK